MKLHHKLKKVIHTNCYFIWAISLLLIAALALCAYILRSSITFDDQFIFSNIYTKHIYIDAKNNYSLRYPGNWQLERDGLGNIAFENPVDLAEGITVSVISAEGEQQVRKAWQIISERNLARANLKIDLIVAKIKNGQSQKMNIAFIRSADKEFYLFGHSQLFESFVNSFQSPATVNPAQK